MNNYCTLFDSNYLDKGIVLYRSLCKVEDTNFTLFVFAFDDMCYDILKKEAFPHMVLVRLNDFETAELKATQSKRSKAEYCWTCTPWIIKYVLSHYTVTSCTYIDADIMFFSSPQYIFDDMNHQGCSVLITPHYFDQTKKAQKSKAHVGEYCVEFNTFNNDKNGRIALDWWADQCLNWCFYARPGTSEWYGDQKYLNAFPERFSGVYICDEHGTGVAPWNSNQLSLVEDAFPQVRVSVKKTGLEYPLVFCHYANISFLTKHLLNASSGIADIKLHRAIYDPYIIQLRDIRHYLEKTYKLNLYNRRKVTKNKLVGFIQAYIKPLLRVRRISDLYWL